MRNNGHAATIWRPKLATRDLCTPRGRSNTAVTTIGLKKYFSFLIKKNTVLWIKITNAYKTYFNKSMFCLFLTPAKFSMTDKDKWMNLWPTLTKISLQDINKCDVLNTYLLFYMCSKNQFTCWIFRTREQHILEWIKSHFVHGPWVSVQCATRVSVFFFHHSY